MRKIMLLLFGLFTVLGSYAQIGIIQGLNSTTLTTGWTTSGFYNTTTTPCEGTHAWRINFYSDYDEFDDFDYGTLTGSITSPNLSAASNGTDTNLSFEWKATEYDAGTGIGYTMYVEYSTNNGTNWTQIGSPIVANATTTCSSFTHTIPGASLPTGSNFKFRVRGVWSAGDSYFWIDNVVITQATAEVPSCITLTSPANEATNISSGLLTWAIPSGIPTGFKLRIGTTSGGTQILNNEDVGMVTSYTLSNLSSGTTYYVTVIPYNLNGDATGCVETSFSTCGTVSNFTQGFENTATATVMPECWSRKYVSTSTFAAVNVSTSYAKTGTKSLAFYNSADAAAQLYAIAPMLDNLGTGTNRIRFSARASATTTSIEVGTMSDPTDETTYNSLETYPLTTNFQDFILDLDFTSTDSYIVFKTNFATTYTYAYIDDVVWEPIPSCSDTTSLSFENVESDSATINWEPGNAVTAWQYAIGASSVTDPSTLTAVDVTGGNPTADITNLTPNTTYKFWVRSNCGSSEFGAWAGPVTFTTACISFAIPSVVENFEGTAGTALPGCWSTTNVSGTVSWNTIAPGTTGDITTTVSGTRIASKTYTSSNALLFSTPFDYSAITAATRVNLYLHRHASAAAADKYTIYANTTPSLEGAEMLLEVFSKTTSAPAVAATGFYNYTADIPESFNGAPQVYIIIQGYTNDGFSSYTLGVDDFKVEYLPACADVTNVAVENATSTTATINWEPGGSETAWQYAIGATSVTDPATLTAVNVTGGNPTAEVTDLTPNTTYKLWVRSNCGSNSFGVWSTPVSFTTACAAYAIPSVVENFEGTTGTALPGCWSTTNVSGTVSWNTIAPGTTGDITTTVSGTRIASKTYTSSNALLFSTPFDYSAITAATRVNLYLHRHASAAAADKYTIYANTTPSLEGAEMLLEVLSKTTSAPAVAATGFYNYTADIPESFNGAPQVYIIIQGYTNDGFSSYTLGVDDFKVEYLPACADVTNVSVENVTSTTATINWEPGGSETAWQYAIGASSVTDPATLTAVDVTGGNPTANVNDLTPNTIYKVWVRSNCGSGSFGVWSPAVSFTTACAAEMAPTVLQSFESAVPACWSEATGTISSSITLSGTTSAWGAATSFANATGGTNKAIKINLYGTKNDWIISNPIDLGTNAGEFRLSYRMALTSYDGTATQATLGTHKVSVIVSTDGGQTWSDADVIKAYTGVGNYSNTGQMEKIDLTAYSGIVKIAFVATTTQLAPDVHFHIDDFKVEELPACADVFNLLSENVLSNAATLNWESNGTETAWQYAIGSSTDTDPSTLTAVEVTGGNTTANITDLTPNTTYKFWVRANCGSGSFGAWVGPVSFTTACTALAIPSSLENFDTTTGTTLPGCWSTAAVSGATVWAGFTPGTSGDVTTTVSGSRVVAKTYTSSDALLFSTPFDYSAITEDTRVNLYLHRHASAAATDKYAVYVNTSASLVGAEMLLEVFSKTTIEPTVAATGFYNYTADIPASFNGAPQVYIIIQGYTNNGFSSYTLAVDDFKVELTDDLKTDTMDLNAFKFYPNPVKDILNVTYTQNITNVEVFNMLGQQVIAKSVNATEGKVDMSNLASGTYLVKVVADQQVKTLKVIKQ